MLIKWKNPSGLNLDLARDTFDHGNCLTSSIPWYVLWKARHEISAESKIDNGTALPPLQGIVFLTIRRNYIIQAGCHSTTGLRSLSRL